MKFAIIGCQHVHLKIFIDEMLELGHEFVGIYDQSSYFLPKSYADTYHVPLFANLQQLLDTGVEVIGNAARNDEKIAVIEWCEKHSLHVMTDKPIAIDVAGLDRLKLVMERGKVKVGMMLTERFEPMMYTLKQLIAQGELGELRDLTFLKPHRTNQAKRPDWFFQKSINGGLIIDLMIHDVDILRWYTNQEAVSFQSQLIKNGMYEYPDFYDNALLQITTEGLITATIKADWLMPESFHTWGDGRIFVAGSEGRVEIRSIGDVLGTPGPYLSLITHRHKTVKVEILEVPNSMAGDFVGQIRGKMPMLTAEDIYACNAEVLRMDAGALKWIKSQ